MRALLVGPQPVGVVAIFGVDPDLMVGDWKDDFFLGASAASGQQFTPASVAGIDAHVGTVGSLGRMYFFFDADKGMIYLVAGQQKDLLERAVSTIGSGKT